MAGDVEPSSPRPRGGGVQRQWRSAISGRTQGERRGWGNGGRGRRRILSNGPSALRFADQRNGTAERKWSWRELFFSRAQFPWAGGPHQQKRKCGRVRYFRR